MLTTSWLFPLQLAASVHFIGAPSCGLNACSLVCRKNESNLSQKTHQTPTNPGETHGVLAGRLALDGVSREATFDDYTGDQIVEISRLCKRHVTRPVLHVFVIFRVEENHKKMLTMIFRGISFWHASILVNHW